MRTRGGSNAQALITRLGPRPIATAGLLLMGVGCTLPTAVSVNGGYLSEIFLGLLVFGPGLGAAYVASSVAALSGVTERDAALASGLK